MQAGFERLEVYQEALLLSKETFVLCKNKLLIREYSFCDQMKRASISVVANIAEGYCRQTKAERMRYIEISLGSANEMIALIDVLKLNYPDIVIGDIRDKYLILGKRLYSFKRKV